MTEQTSLAPRGLHLLFSWPWARPQGDMGVGRGAPHTLLRSLAVTPSSSRQGSLCTNASIWYFALMNSDLMGLHGTHRRPCEQSSGKLPSRPLSQEHGPDHHPCSPTYWTLSWGLALRRPLCTCAGSSRECSQMELAPLLASVCTICGEEMPSKRVPTPCWAWGGHSQSVCCSWKYHQGSYCVPGIADLYPVRPPKVMCPV